MLSSKPHLTALAGVSVVIIVLCLIPELRLSSRRYLHFVQSDKVLHFASFLLLGFLAFLSFRGLGRTRMLAIGFSLLYCWLLGGLTELLQPLAGRSAENGDFLADVLGSSGGMAIGLALTLIRNRRTG